MLNIKGKINEKIKTVDDFIVHLTPVILGGGIRLFDDLDKDKFKVEIGEAISSKRTTHLCYNVSKK